MSERLIRKTELERLYEVERQVDKWGEPTRIKVRRYTQVWSAEKRKYYWSRHKDVWLRRCIYQEWTIYIKYRSHSHPYNNRDFEVTVRFWYNILNESEARRMAEASLDQEDIKPIGAGWKYQKVGVRRIRSKYTTGTCDQEVEYIIHDKTRGYTWSGEW